MKMSNRTAMTMLMFESTLMPLSRPSDTEIVASPQTTPMMMSCQRAFFLEFRSLGRDRR